MATNPVGWRLRGARAAIFAAMCVGVSAAGHAWISADGVPLWALGLAFVAILAAGSALAGRQRGFASIAALMLLGELGQHLVFTAAQNSASAAGAPAIPEFVSGHVVPASAWVCGMPHSGMSGHGGEAGMIGAHVVAGLLCAGWLRSGEAAFFRLVQALVARSPIPLLIWPEALVVPDRPRIVPRGDGRLAARRTRLLSTSVARRGPPGFRIRVL
ncbi:MAG TPA: hypothetical protein VFN97_01100 [Actinospica sp.]|nr:hypothetical protein [Actinospica sp.]